MFAASLSWVRVMADQDGTERCKRLGNNPL